MKKIISRPKYIDMISPFIGKQLIKVLVGERRIGKTTLLLQLIDHIKQKDRNANIIYINKELHRFKFIKTDDDLYDHIKENINAKKQNYIFIDEIQEIKNFEKTLRELLIQKHDLYCTGSNAKLLSGDLATMLSGRYMEFRIHGLSYEEFLQFHQLDNNMKSLQKYIRFGGLPYLAHLELDAEIVYGYLKSIYNTIILKDVVSRYNIRDIDFLERLVEYLADNLGSYVSSKKITDFLKSQRIRLSVNTVMNYLQYLTNAFFINKVHRYDIQGKKLFEINEKYYFSDLGLKHSIIPYTPGDIGKIFENLVFNKLLLDGYSINIGKLQDLEIDFIAKKRDQIKYIQVAYQIPNEQAHQREFGNLLKIKDNFEKIVISADELITGNYKGVKHIHILEFLSN